MNEGNALSLPKGWELKKLGEVCTLQRGFDLPTHSRIEGEFPLVSSNGITDRINAWKVKGPGVVTGRSGSIGNIHFVEEDFWPLNTALYVKDFHKNYPRFVYYLLTQFDIGRFASGAGVPTLNRNHVHDEEVCISTSYAEQQRIVAILDEAFAGIAKAKANAEQNLKNAKELFESYLQGVFENKGDEWEETSLKSEVDLLVGFAFKSKEYTEAEDDIVLLRGDNIMQGNLRWEDVKRWRKSEYDDFKKYQLKENDIVLAMDRPWVKAGLKIAKLSNYDLPALLVQRTACLRAKPKLDNSFLFHLLRSKRFMNYLIDVQTGIGVPHISGQQILDFAFSRPSLKTQQTIVHKLDALSAETKRLEAIYLQKINDLEELKKSVLQKAFSGELKTLNAEVAL